MTTRPKRKLIEVALPLEAINRAARQEKDRKVGKPQQVHHWWARQPIVAARAVLFAQLVDDPSAHPDRFPTEQAQAVERRRLFDLIERLVVWENNGNEALLRQAHDAARPVLVAGKEERQGGVRRPARGERSRHVRHRARRRVRAGKGDRRDGPAHRGCLRRLRHGRSAGIRPSRG